MLHRKGLSLGTADAFVRGKEQHFLIPNIQQASVPQPMKSVGLEKPQRQPLETGFKERKKSKYQRS
jgi:hypothetical protein